MWRRVVVGVDGSLASLAALREAAAIAADAETRLHVVWVWGKERVGPTTVAASTHLDRTLVARGRGAIAEAFASSLGGRPDGVTVTTAVRAYEGNPGRVLTAIASRESDLLVVGAGVPGRWPRLPGSSADRCCLRHARCPVLVVPPSQLVLAATRRPGLAKRLPQRLLRSIT